MPSLSPRDQQSLSQRLRELRAGCHDRLQSELDAASSQSTVTPCHEVEGRPWNDHDAFAATTLELDATLAETREEAPANTAALVLATREGSFCTVHRVKMNVIFN